MPMGLGDFISGLFLKEEQKLMRNQDKLEQKVSKTEKAPIAIKDESENYKEQKNKTNGVTDDQFFDDFFFDE